MDIIMSPESERESLKKAPGKKNTGDGVAWHKNRYKKFKLMGFDSNFEYELGALRKMNTFLFAIALYATHIHARHIFVSFSPLRGARGTRFPTDCPVNVKVREKEPTWSMKGGSCFLLQKSEQRSTF